MIFPLSNKASGTLVQYITGLQRRPDEFSPPVHNCSDNYRTIQADVKYNRHSKILCIVRGVGCHPVLYSGVGWQMSLVCCYSISAHSDVGYR